MKLDDAVTRAIHDQTRAVAPPVPDLDAIRRRARPRILARKAAAAMCVGGLIAGAFAVNAGLDGESRTAEPAIGQLDFDGGLRAFVDQDNGEIHLGGRSFPIGVSDGLDTSAAATPYGALFFTGDQEVRLLAETGQLSTLAAAIGPPLEGFHPSSAFDAVQPLAAWVTATSDAATVQLYDFDSQRVVAISEVPCDGGSPSDCDVTVVAVDQGLVFVRTDEGSWVWVPGTDEDTWTRLTGPDADVYDVRNKVIMIESIPSDDGFRGGPINKEWTVTRGASDAQLSFDGRHVLYWSTTLEGLGDAARISLAVPGDPDLVFVTFDSDGSVLVATPSDPTPTDPALDTIYYDCELPGGECTEIGRLDNASGDPVFLGNDM